MNNLFLVKRQITNQYVRHYFPLTI